MKNTLKTMAACIAVASFMSCSNSETTETNTDSLADVSSATNESSTTVSTVTPGKYINLTSGQEVEIDRDPSTGYWIDVTTKTPIEYYISTDYRDTFDMQGRNVNFALDRSGDKYMVNEERLKVKMDSDGDMKAKTADGDKIKYDASSDELKLKSGDTKEKLSDDKYKSKTDTSKTKIGG